MAAEIEAVTDASPATTVGTAGTFGFAIGVTDADAADAADVPPAFVAVAVNVYAVPFVRPDTTHDPDAPVIVHVAPPGDAVTVCDVAAAPDCAAETDTVTDASPTTPVGAAGTFGISAPDVITRFPVPVTETAANRPFPYVTPYQLLSAADDLDVHVTPSGLVITRLPVPVMDTATNWPLPYVTDCQSMSAAPVLSVQLMPSGLVITRLPTPASWYVLDTATNRPLPYVTDSQRALAGVVLDVHVMPSGLVITRLPVPLMAVATNRPLA